MTAPTIRQLLHDELRSARQRWREEEPLAEFLADLKFVVTTEDALQVERDAARKIADALATADDDLAHLAAILAWDERSWR